MMAASRSMVLAKRWWVARCTSGGGVGLSSITAAPTSISHHGISSPIYRSYHQDPPPISSFISASPSSSRSTCWIRIPDKLTRPRRLRVHIKEDIGCDHNHWLVLMDKPETDTNITRDHLIHNYIKTLAQILGSEDEARMKIYSISTQNYYCFGALISKKLSKKLLKLPGVLSVVPDLYLPNKKVYGGEPFINGQAGPFDMQYYSLCQIAFKREIFGIFPEYGHPLGRYTEVDECFLRGRDPAVFKTSGHIYWGIFQYLVARNERLYESEEEMHYRFEIFKNHMRVLSELNCTRKGCRSKLKSNYFDRTWEEMYAKCVAESQPGFYDGSMT